MSLADTKIKTLWQGEGFGSEDAMLASYSFDSVVMGICINRDCDYTTEVEPDCREGYCEECESQTVQSPLVIRGII